MSRCLMGFAFKKIKNTMFTKLISNFNQNVFMLNNQRRKPQHHFKSKQTDNFFWVFVSLGPNKVLQSHSIQPCSISLDIPVHCLFSLFFSSLSFSFLSFLCVAGEQEYLQKESLQTDKVYNEHRRWAHFQRKENPGVSVSLYANEGLVFCSGMLNKWYLCKRKIQWWNITV